MRLRLLAAACVAFTVPGIAQAGTSLLIQPVSVNVTAPDQSSVVTLRNTGDESVTLQLRVFQWTQDGGSDTLTPAADVVASPPAATIPAGEAYTVRIARTTGAVTEGEKAYRLWIDQLPTAEQEHQTTSGVDLRLRYDLSVFFGNANAAPSLKWRSYRTGDQLIAEVTNNGTAHARIAGLQIGDAKFGGGVNGYVLPGSTQRWTSQPGAAVPAANANVTLVAQVGNSEIRQPITIADN